MRKTIAALSILLACGCNSPTAGIVLVFPSAQLKAFAAHATLQVITPLATGDECSQFLAYPPLIPPTNQIVQTSEVDLVNGVASKPLTQIPVGRQTLLMSVSDKTDIVILHGCLTTNVTAGASLQITLQPVVPAMNDMATVDMATPDLAMPKVDMVMHKYLSITVNELRAPSRAISAVSVTVTDSMGASLNGMTDANGKVSIDTMGMVGPFSITASAPPVNNFQGAVTLNGVAPTFTTDTVAVTIPVELDPPPAAAMPNTITATIADSVNAQTYGLYYLNTDFLFTDMPAPVTMNAAGTGLMLTTPALAAGNYRAVVVKTPAAPVSAATPGFVVGQSQGITTMNEAANNQLTSTLQLNVSKGSVMYTTQTYGISLVIPATPTQARIPLVPENTAIAAAQPEPATKVPAMVNMVQAGASVMAALIGDGTGIHAEVRKQYTGTISATMTDTLSGLPDPTTATVTPATMPVSHTAPFTITATPPAAFNVTSAFVHVHIHGGAAPTFHWHMLVPAANPTTINVPANVLPSTAVTYTLDVSFVQLFSPLPDGTVVGSLNTDYSKLIRLIPLAVTEASQNLMVN